MTEAVFDGPVGDFDGPVGNFDGPIGVFDSGVGGLTVVAALRRRLPHESILYLGDTARLPYGSKSPATVTRYTQRNVDFLIRHGAKAVVVACNTASALALPNLALARLQQGDQEHPVPTWGVVEPGAATAVAATRGGAVGVIGTESTIRSESYVQALHRRRPGLRVLTQACPLFVPLVEEGWLDDPIAEQVAQRYLQPLLDGGIDTLVLGCTHYPLLKPVLERVMGLDVELVDSAEAVAALVAAELERRGLLRRATAAAEQHVCVTDASESFERLVRRILGPRHGVLELVDIG